MRKNTPNQTTRTQRPRAHMITRRPMRNRLEPLDDLRPGRALGPQSLEIIELTDLGSEHVHDHIAGIDQHPVAIGQALDMDILDAVFLQASGDVFRDRTDVPVGPARGDDHVVGICRFATKVDGERLFRLHIVEAGEDHIQRLVGVRLRLQGRSWGRCFTLGSQSLG